MLLAQSGLSPSRIQQIKSEEAKVSNVNKSSAFQTLLAGLNPPQFEHDIGCR